MKILSKYLVISACQLSAAAALAVEPEQIAKLLADNTVSEDRFGFSVAISGDTAVVGTDQGTLFNNAPGAAYVFAKSDSGTWYQQTKLTASDAADGDDFGIAVAIDGDKIVVGAVGDHPAGSAYVFVQNPDGSWPATESFKLTPSDGEQGDGFGQAVAVAGDTIFVGAPWNGPGEVYVFYPTTAGGWVEYAVVNNWFDTIFLYADDPNARFGWSISAVSSVVEAPSELLIDGVLVTIGAPGEDNFGKAWTFHIGHANVIDLSVFPEDLLGLPLGFIHMEEHDPCPSPCIDNDQPMQFGWSVDIDAGPGLIVDDANRTYVFVVIGAPYYDDSSDGLEMDCVDSGAAFLYEFYIVGAPRIERLGDRCHSNARIGSAVAISLERRGTILIGAPFFDPDGQPRGRVFGLESATESLTAWSDLFNPPVPEPPVEEYEWGSYELSASDGSPLDAFGSAVAIDGATSVIGSRFDDTDVGYDTGSAYIFQQTPKFASTLLFNFITSLNLRGGTERSLTVKVSKIEAEIDLGDTNLALNLINAFIEDVAEKSGTQLTDIQAGVLTLWAIEIVSLLTFY